MSVCVFVSCWFGVVSGCEAGVCVVRGVVFVWGLVSDKVRCLVCLSLGAMTFGMGLFAAVNFFVVPLVAGII